MALRAGHGSGSGTPRIEVLPADEQPAGIPGQPPPPYPEGLGVQSFDPVPSITPPGGSKAQGPTAPRKTPILPAGHDTRFGKGNAYAKLGGLARAAKAQKLRALRGLGLRGAAPEVIAPYLEDAFEFADSEVERLAKECGGGVCAPNAAALVQSAALAMAGSRAAYAEGDLLKGAKLGVEVRQNLLGARELAVRDAQLRHKQTNPHEQFSKEFE